MKRTGGWRWLIAVLAITLWAFAVVSLYYVVHKPFDVLNIAALLSALLDLLVAGAIVCVGVGIGSHCLPNSQEVSPVERLVLGAGIGLGVLGLAVLALGLVGGYHRGLIWGLLIVGLALSSRTVSQVVGTVRKSGVELPSGWLYKFLAGFLAVMLLLTLPQALLPPTAWDSLVYHLTGPKLDIQAHRHLPDVDIVHLGFPALMEMLYTMGLLLKGPAVAQVIHWAFTVLTLLLLYALALRHFDARVAWLSMALLYSAPTIVLLSSWAYIDAALMFYGLAAVHVLLRWRESRDGRWLLMAGVFCGLAMGTKYTAAGLTFALGAFILWDERAEGWRKSVRDALSFGGMATIVTLPWLVKNWAFLGNPLYPFLFGGRYWDAFRQSWYGRPGTGLAYTEPWRLLTVPWEMTVSATEGRTGFAATIGPLFLIGLVVLIFVWRQASEREKNTLTALVFISLVQYIIWLVGVALSAPLMQTRLLLPVFPLLSIMAAYALDRVNALRRPAFAVDWILSIVVVLSLSLTLLGAVMDFAHVHPLTYLTGWESKDRFLKRRLGAHYAVMDYINRELPDQARLYFWWEPRSYYCNRECRPDAILDAFVHLVHRFDTAPAIAEYLKGQGYTHVLLYEQGMDFVLTTKSDPIREKDLDVLRELERDHLTPVYGEGQAYVLYRLNDELVGQRGDLE